MSILESYGFRPELLDSLSDLPPSPSPLVPARVVFQSGETVRVISGEGERLALPSGRLLALAGPPVVGDWLLVSSMPGSDSVLAQQLLPRRGSLSRLAAGGRNREQLIASNVDAVLLLAPASASPNARRIERGIAWAASCGLPAIVGVGKIDLAADRAPVLEEARRSAAGRPVVPFSARSGEGVDELLSLLPVGSTLALAGPSGAGKSTLLNRLVGEEVERTGELRSWDGKGRHTTTWKRLVLLPSGRLLVDTPGYRELALWDAEGGLDEAFPEFEEASRRCRFRDCRHESEPGCAVRAGVEGGSLDVARLESRRKLEREAAARERMHDPELARQERDRWKRIQMDLRKRLKEKG